MRIDLSLPPGVDPNPFKEYFLEYLRGNLSERLCISLANLLAVDYAGRLDSKPDLALHINECTLRIKKQLGLKVITDESFSSIMNIFIIAITPERDIDSNESNKPKEQSHDALIDSIIASYFYDLSPEETVIIRTSMREILNSANGKEMMNVASSNPKLFYSIVVSAIRKNDKLQEVLESVKLHLTRIFLKDKEQLKKQSGLQTIVSKISLMGGLILTASTGLVLGGLALPALILPATATVVKVSPELGEKIASPSDKSPDKKGKEGEIITTTLSLTDKENSVVHSAQKNVEQKLVNAKLKNLLKSIEVSKQNEKIPGHKFEERLNNKNKLLEKGRSR